MGVELFASNRIFYRVRYGDVVENLNLEAALRVFLGLYSGNTIISAAKAS